MWWLQHQDGAGCSIELMKFDMGGSAAVLGAAKAIGQIKHLGVEATYNVHFIVAACENMISGTGMRPGDILTASNGKTNEVNNTDAEGRLTLADALIYACNQGMDKMVDMATLTGACVVALEPSIAGVFTPSDDMAKEVLAASEISGEKFWRMPIEEKRRDLCVTSSLEFQKRSEDTSDEHCTIFYDKEKVELLEGGTFWLLESPSIPGSTS